MLDLMSGRDTLIFEQGDFPSWSWDSRWLAFDMYDSLGLHVRMLEIATGIHRRLDVGEAMVPCWMPGDSELVVVSFFPDGAQTLLRTNLDGSRTSRLLPNRTFDSEPGVSPDGTQFAWLRMGGATRQLGIFVSRFGGASEDFLANYGQDPAWSPDGTHIAFAGYNPEQNSISLWMMRSDGAEQIRLTGP